MVDYKEPLFYRDVDTDYGAVKERLLDALLSLNEPGFLRRPPEIVSEKQFETDETLHKATFRFVPTGELTDQIVGFNGGQGNG